ncbi:radical SAM protein [Curvivirga aplysinae]|uniref:radical SAM protein n=1 Tax=Curvivirga aplysinae TaxID=2529852 RepID=UPI0012BB889E|nr:radical SAM protein [Curvivirga aplysinae]MTI08922.1 hypothetical protein [Curvivirga aplysinae]
MNKPYPDPSMSLKKEVSYLSYSEKLRSHMARVMHLKEFGFSYPAHFTLGLVTYCDQACKGCYAGGYRFNPNIMFTASLDTLKNTLKAATNFGSEYTDHPYYSKDNLGLKSVSLVGSGEPMLYPHLVPLIKYMKEDLNLDIGSYTNGYTLQDGIRRQGIDLEPQDIASAVLDHFKFVRISLDAATERTHSYVRGAKGQFPTIIENIRNLVERRNAMGKTEPTIGLQFTVDDKNVQEILPAAKLAKDLGVDYLAYKPKYVPWYIRKERMTAMTLDDIKESLEQAQALEDASFRIHGKYNQFKLAWGPDRTNTGEAYQKCGGVWLSSYLDIDVKSENKTAADLRVFICVNKDKEEREDDGAMKWSIGPIKHETDFTEFWQQNMPDLVQKIDVMKCVSGCKNDPYNRILSDFMQKDSSILEGLSIDPETMPADTHINHI